MLVGHSTPLIIYLSKAIFSVVSMRFFSSMKLLIIILFAILFPYYCYSSSVVEGANDVELENQLKVLNKVPIKIIQTEEGDVFDCIKINKQPSLDHPLLKNHVIKTRPISHSIDTMVHNEHEIISMPSSSVKSSSKTARLRNLGCPDGTVPIRRISKEDLIRAKLISQSQLVHSVNVGEQNKLENPGEGQFFSIAKTRKDSGIDYVGIQADINIYNPLVTEDQVSTAQLWIENGPTEKFNSLQAGWIVAPFLYGDNKTRLFGKWQVHDSNKSEGCYNILCPGFVQVDRNRTIDSIIGPISQFGTRRQYTIKISISQDGGGNWWLDVEDMKIGYWPAELGFSQLTQGSSVIAWGGLASKLGPVTTVPVPPSGNGHYPHPWFYYERQCFMRQMKVVPIKTLHWEDPTEKIIDSFATNKDCSDIIYYGHKEFQGFAHTLAFGGPGGNY